jgi:hypothetical protein
MNTHYASVGQKEGEAFGKMNSDTGTSSKLRTPHIQDSSVNSPILPVNWIHTIWKIINMYLCTAVIGNVRNGNTIIKSVMDISSASYFSVVYTLLIRTQTSILFRKSPYRLNTYLVVQFGYNNRYGKSSNFNGLPTPVPNLKQPKVW